MPIVIKAVNKSEYDKWLKKAKQKFAKHDIQKNKLVMNNN